MRRPLFLFGTLVLGLVAACGSTGIDLFVAAPSSTIEFRAIGRGLGRQYDPTVATFGDGLALAWCETDDAGRPQVWVGAIDGGTLVTGTMAYAGEEVRSPRLFPRPGGWLLSLQPFPYILRLSLIDQRGRPSPVIPLNSPRAQSDFWALPGADGLVSTWTTFDNGYDVWLGLLDSQTGDVLDAGRFTGAGYEFRPVITRVGSSPLLVWEEFRGGPNGADDVVGQWLGGGRFAFALDDEQSSPRAIGGADVALIGWRDRVTTSVQVGRVRPDATLLDPTGVTLGVGDGVSITSTTQGFLVAFNGVRDGADWVRVVPVPEAGDVEPSSGVWLHDGPSSSGSPVWLDGRLLAFTRRDEDGGTSVRVRRLGFGAVGASCRRGDDCLTSRCERGECIE